MWFTVVALLAAGIVLLRAWTGCPDPDLPGALPPPHRGAPPRDEEGCRHPRDRDAARHRGLGPGRTAGRRGSGGRAGPRNRRRSSCSLPAARAPSRPPATPVRPRGGRCRSGDHRPLLWDVEAFVEDAILSRSTSARAHRQRRRRRGASCSISSRRSAPPWRCCWWPWSWVWPGSCCSGSHTELMGEACARAAGAFFAAVALARRRALRVPGEALVWAIAFRGSEPPAVGTRPGGNRPGTVRNLSVSASRERGPPRPPLDRDLVRGGPVRRRLRPRAPARDRWPAPSAPSAQCVDPVLAPSFALEVLHPLPGSSTVTPPALPRMLGVTPHAAIVQGLSPSGVVGWFASSRTRVAGTHSRRCPPGSTVQARGASTWSSTPIRSSPSCPCLEPIRCRLCSGAARRGAEGLRDSGRRPVNRTPPPPCSPSDERAARTTPRFPNPSTAIRMCSRVHRREWAMRSSANSAPGPVAASRPSDPPRPRLPGDHRGESPRDFEYSSYIPVPSREARC